MKCEVCGNEFSSGSVLFGFGPVCSEDCAQIGKGRIDAQHEELRKEPLGQMPEALETGDFERWALKLAVQVLDSLSEAQRDKLKDANPFMLIPSEFALELKDRIIRHIPRAYVSEVEARGHSRMFYGGTYCFRQAVPASVIYEACKKAQILQ